MPRAAVSETALSGTVRPRPSSGPADEGRCHWGATEAEWRTFGGPFPFILRDLHPYPAFWLQAVWVGGAGTSGMLMPAVEGPSVEKERGEGRYLRSASRGRGLGPGSGVVNRQPPDGQE